MNRYFILADPTTLEVRLSQPLETQPDNSLLYEPTELLKPCFDQYPNPTAIVEGMSESELAQAALDDEFNRYLQRKEDGICAYLKIASELRLAKLDGIISNEAHRSIETALEGVRAEVVLGQWIGAQEKLQELGSDIIGQEMYDDLLNRITSYISTNY